MSAKVASYPKPGARRRQGRRGRNGNDQNAARPALTGAQRSAVFMLALPEETVADVFRHMEPDEIKRIMTAMSRLNNVPAEAIQSVFDEFAHYVKHEPILLEGGAEYLRGALHRAVGIERAQTLLGELPEAEVMRPVTLGNVDPRTLANVLESEHPQTIALLLAHMEPKQAGTVLGAMPNEVQQEVMVRVARLERVSPEVVRDIEASIVAELQTIGTSEQHELKGTEQAAALLNNMDRNIGVEILARLEEADEDIAGKIRQSMFTFEDLAGVDDRGFQSILKEISSDALLMSLKTASPELKDKFFRNMSSRAADMMRDDLAAMGPTRLSDVETAQKEIAQIALRLQEEGTIVIAGAGEDVV